MRKSLLWAGLTASCLISLVSIGSQAQPVFTPEDLGQTVNGFQDDFTGATRDENWVPVPPELDFYEQVDGLLRVTVVGEALDTHLLYEASGYSDAAQEVLARIRVTAFGTGDAPRCGISVAVDPETSQGINLHFRDHDQDGVLGRQFKLLDDRRAWGPAGLDIDWEDNTWYWLRLRQTTSIPGEEPNIQAKVWLGDGTEPEPGEWQMSWTRSDRLGFAGIVGSSIGGLSEFEVDYILIKAEGLPEITPAVAAFPTPFFLSIRQHPTNALVNSGQSVTFTIQVNASSPPTFQWQRAEPGTTNFVDIAGATAESYTTAPVATGDNGAKFRAVVSMGGTSLISEEAVLTLGDEPPVPTAALASVDRVLEGITVIFSEPVVAEGANNPANYAVAGVTITSARLLSNGTHVVLKTSPLDPTGNYTLSVTGIEDLTGNATPPNTQIPVSLALHVPADFGQSLNGFQDDFTGANRDENWVPVPPELDFYEQVDGLLRVTVVGEALDTHLLYEASGYSDITQEVLARIRVTAFGTGDAPRGGISVAADPETSQGINLLFRDNDQDGVSGRQFKLLDDRRAWGPAGLDIDWEDNTWYWLRLRQTTSIPEEGESNIQAKVWLGDGTEPEPAEWQMNWTRSDRFGYAGIVGSSSGGLSEFEVDYILIKAEGLPEITAESSTFPGIEPPGPSISVARDGENIVLTWTGAGVLESAAEITGPWAAVAGASSPHSAPLSDTRRFYRVRFESP